MDSENKKGIKQIANNFLIAAGMQCWTYEGQVEAAKKGECFFGALAIFPEYAYNPKTGQIEKTGNYVDLVAFDESKKKAKEKQKQAEAMQLKAEAIAKAFAQELGKSSKKDKPKEFGE